ncbi:hypothetical protein GN956_G5636 [Arapaima gigas]
MASEEFEKLLEMFRCLYEEMKALLQGAQLCYGEEKKRLLKDFSSKYREAEEMLREMDELLLDAPPVFRNPMSSKLRCYRRDIVKLQRDMKSYDLSSGLSGRVGGSRRGAYGSPRSQRLLLLRGTESLHHATQSIKRSQQVALETEHVSGTMMEELGEQREQLDGARQRLIHAGENLSRSRRIVRSVSRRVMTNKMLLAVVILTEVCILGAAIYLKFFLK